MNRTKVFFKSKRAALSAACIASVAWSGSALAIELGHGFGLDLTLSAVSDYRDTGISQTKGDPALQAEATLRHESGVYVGAFMSNVDYSKAYREDMYYIGITVPLTEEIYFDTYLGRYEYPNYAYGDVNEFYAELGGYGAMVGYTLNFDQRGHTPDSYNVFLGYNFELPYETNLLVKYGYSDANQDAFVSKSEKTRQSYYDWEVKLSKDVLGVNVFASYIDTDLSESECYSATGYDDTCSATVVVGVSKTF